MEKYYLIIIILLILLTSSIGYLIYQNKNKPTPQSDAPKIVYLQKKDIYGDENKNLPLVSGNLLYNRRFRNPNLPPLVLGNKIGILSSITNPKESPLNLFAVVIDAWRETYGYFVEDKNGFKIPLLDKYNYKFVNGDVVEDIPSKPGKWSVVLY